MHDRQSIASFIAAFLLVAVVTRAPLTATAAEPRMNYGQARDLLVKYTKVVELTSPDGGRVAICPEWQGRVMTSTVSELKGQSLGWINRTFLEKGEKDAHFNNYGGEDRFWLGPEGGQFSLWFKPDAEQTLENWYTPPALNDGAFTIASKEVDPFYRMTRRLEFANAAKTKFNLDVVREIRMVAPQQFAKIFGEEAKGILTSGALKMVGFQSINTIVNRGAPMTMDKGLVAIWILGMFPPGAKTKIIVPLNEGPESALGPPVKSDYFGKVPAERLKVTNEAAYFLGDGKFRSKIGVSQRRGTPLAGSIDMDSGVLTLVTFTLPDEPAAFPYVNNAWELPQKQPFVGDVFNSYNDGPPAPGKPALGGFYELESVSPAAALAPGKSLTHVHTTFHVQGEKGALVRLAKVALGVNVPNE